ncbi:MAG: RES family NAD+ phosphorylase [Gemmatimonadales bacterium]
MIAPAARPLWRVFPWDRAAAEGEPFSASYLAPRQVSGRFDLGGMPPVLYLGESAVHAIGEKIQRYRGQTLEAADLKEFGKPLALVEVSVVVPPTSIADLCDPSELVRWDCRPDELMSRDGLRTRSIGKRLYDGGLDGFRVWSALTGDWHSTVLFMDPAKAVSIATFGTPTEITLESAALKEAARFLAISVKG